MSQHTRIFTVLWFFVRFNLHQSLCNNLKCSIMSPVSVIPKYIKVPLLLRMCQLGLLVSLYCDILLVFGSVLKLALNLVFDFRLCGVLKEKVCWVWGGWGSGRINVQ
jgi:hypothetical protein